MVKLLSRGMAAAEEICSISDGGAGKVFVLINSLTGYRVTKNLIYDGAFDINFAGDGIGEFLGASKASILTPLRRLGSDHLVISSVLNVNLFNTGDLIDQQQYDSVFILAK